MRRAAVALAVALPAALLTPAVADAGPGRTASPPLGGPVTMQADLTRKAGPAVPPSASHRGKRLRVNDAATPPSPGTAPAMSASSSLPAAQDDVRQAARAVSGARAPPPAA